MKLSYRSACITPWLGLLPMACQASGPAPRTTAPMNPITISASAREMRPSASPEPAPMHSNQPTGDPAPLQTRAPQPALAPDPALQPLLDLCGPGDVALHQAARKLLEAPLAEQRLDTARVTFAVRISGGSHVHPRAFRAQTEELELAKVQPRLSSWLRTLGPSSLRACGVALQQQADHRYSLSLVAGYVLAELAPLPSQVERGARLHLRARLLVPATHVELSILGPRGAPRPVTAGLNGDEVNAAFYLDSPGTHRIQLMVDQSGGPEPALEAWVAVSQPLASTPLAKQAPGEQRASLRTKPEQVLLAMINAARASEDLPALIMDPKLNRLANEHARAMHGAARLAHDLGEGSPVSRVQTAAIQAHAVGENLARAATLERVHRAIWSSASHRANLLGRHFDSVGIGLTRDTRGDWWVCELLVDSAASAGRMAATLQR